MITQREARSGWHNHLLDRHQLQFGVLTWKGNVSFGREKGGVEGKGEVGVPSGGDVEAKRSGGVGWEETGEVG